MPLHSAPGGGGGASDGQKLYDSLHALAFDPFAGGSISGRTIFSTDGTIPMIAVDAESVDFMPNSLSGGAVFEFRDLHDPTTVVDLYVPGDGSFEALHSFSAPFGPNIDLKLRRMYADDGTTVALDWSDPATVSIHAPYLAKSSAYPAVSGDKILADTSAGIFTITLPASPSVGDNVEIVDAQGTFGTNTLTVARNGESISGDASDLTASTNNEAFKLIFAGGSMGWQVVRFQ